MKQTTTSCLHQSVYEKKIHKASGLLSKGNIKKAYSLISELASYTNTGLPTTIKIAKLIARTGNYSGLIQYLINAASVYRTSIDIYLLLASTYKTTGQLEQSANTYTFILSLDPNCIEAIIEYGIILSNRGNHPEAIAYFNKALGALNNLACAGHGDTNNNYFCACYCNLGLSHAGMGQFDTAISYYEKALAIDGKNIIAITDLADLYEKQGAKEKSLSTLRILDNKQLNNTGPALVYASLAGFHKQYDKAITHLTNAADHTADRNHAYALHLQLGKIYEDTKQYDRAFFNYEKANNFLPDHYNKAEEEKSFQALKYAFTSSGPDIENINIDNRAIFIIGMPRSGTSLIEQILSSHAQIHAGGEQIYFHQLSQALERESGRPYPACIKDLSADQIHRMSENHKSYISSITDKSRFTDKLPHNFLNVGLINIVAPNSFIIHCMRDPIDICLSCYANEFAGFHAYSNRLENLAHYYKLYASLVEHWKSTLNIKWIDISYEGLTKEPEATIRALIDYIELDWDDNCLSFNKTRRNILTASYDQANKPIYSTSVSRWKHFEKHLDQLRNNLDMK